MIELAVIVLRALQYGAASLLLGLPAFLIYSRRALGAAPQDWARRTVGAAAAAVAALAVLALVAQTAMMAGSLPEALQPGTLGMVASGTSLGMALVVRCVAGLAAGLAAALFGPSRTLWVFTAVAGAVVCATFAWTGHGAAAEDADQWWRIGADVIHALAAAIWIGALAAFAVLSRSGPGDDGPLARSLTGFARTGSIAVAALTLTGLINTVALAGWSGIGELADGGWGRLLLVKLTAVLGMIALAAANRFVLTPAMTAAGRQADRRLIRVSLALEFALGLGVLAIVATMGVLEPPATS